MRLSQESEIEMKMMSTAGMFEKAILERKPANSSWHFSCDVANFLRDQNKEIKAKTKCGTKVVCNLTWDPFDIETRAFDDETKKTHQPPWIRQARVVHFRYVVPEHGNFKEIATRFEAYFNKKTVHTLFMHLTAVSLGMDRAKHEFQDMIHQLSTHISMIWIVVNGTAAWGLFPREWKPLDFINYYSDGFAKQAPNSTVLIDHSFEQERNPCALTDFSMSDTHINKRRIVRY